jgi:hypothetical protein
MAEDDVNEFTTNVDCRKETLKPKDCFMVMSSGFETAWRTVRHHHSNKVTHQDLAFGGLIRVGHTGRVCARVSSTVIYAPTESLRLMNEQEARLSLFQLQRSSLRLQSLSTVVAKRVGCHRITGRLP